MMSLGHFEDLHRKFNMAPIFMYSAVTITAVLILIMHLISARHNFAHLILIIAVCDRFYHYSYFREKEYDLWKG
jgi:hypothetical protein